MNRFLAIGALAFLDVDDETSALLDFAAHYRLEKTGLTFRFTVKNALDRRRMWQRSLAGTHVRVGYREVARSTDTRTLIAALSSPAILRP